MKTGTENDTANNTSAVENWTDVRNDTDPSRGIAGRETANGTEAIESTEAALTDQDRGVATATEDRTRDIPVPAATKDESAIEIKRTTVRR